jgi:hypothetical protein
MPFGLRPVRYKSGESYNGAANMYFVPASDGTALFIGDPVIIAGSGDADGVSTVTRSAAGARITGVVVGFAPVPGAVVDTAVRVGYRAASTADYVLVADDPALLFEANEDGVGGFLAVTDIGNNVDLIAGTGSTFTKLSGYMLDSSTKATTSAGVRIVGQGQRVNNTIGTVNTVWMVGLIETTESPDTGVTGV